MGAAIREAPKAGVAPAPIPGYLLIADRGNNRILLVDGARRILWRYPRPGVSPSYPFRFDDDSFFGPGLRTIISNQEAQNTIEILSFPAGRLLWHYGHPDVRGAGQGYLNTPDDAYLLPNGLRTVADAGNCRILFIAPSGRIVRRLGTPGVCAHAPPHELGAVNAGTPLPGGGILVSEIQGSWIDGFSKTGRVLFSFQAPVSYPSDPQWLGHGRILLADYSRPGGVVIVDTRGRVLWRYGPRAGHAELDHPSLAVRLRPGLVAVNDDYRDRVVLISQRLHRIVWQYGHTDVPGSAPGYLNTPDGLDLLPYRRALRIRAIRALVDRHSQRPSSPPAAGAGRGLRIVPARYALPAPVEREVTVFHGGHVYLAGGLDAEDRSASGVFRLNPSTGRLVLLGSLPQAVHDAAGAFVDGRLVVFGGGSSASSDAVQAFDPARRSAEIVGRLPRPLSDLAAASVDGTIYLVGGFDGTSPQRAIYATRDGVRFRRVGTLPIGLRYTAVTADGPRLVIAGGEAASGPTASVFVFDTRTRALTLAGKLPSPVAHAAAIALGGDVYLIGGRDAGGRALGSVFLLGPGGHIIALRHLARPLADTGAAGTRDQAWLLGGWRGAPVRQVLEAHRR